MSGFSADWLALREPVDHDAVNARLRSTLQRWAAGRDRLEVVDLGCGTGSNFRGLARDLGVPQHWSLIDKDAALLELAELRSAERIKAMGGAASATTRIADLSSGDIAELIAGADLVTAAALFDLVSSASIAAMADAIAREGCAFYTTLTYDGIAAWLPEQPCDGAMRDAFNAHQRTDKGFGPAAGPDASQELAEAFARHGYDVKRGKSAWVLDDAYGALRAETDRGWARAVAETKKVSQATIDDWLAVREAAAHAVTIVGHEDLLALPAG